jgi:hypothetical protein
MMINTFIAATAAAVVIVVAVAVSVAVIDVDLVAGHICFGYLLLLMLFFPMLLLQDL